LKRRDFIRLLGGAAAWPLAAGAQQPAMQVVGFVSGRSLASDSDLVAVFLRALNEAGYVNGQNVAIEFRWADGQLDRLPELLADLVERKVAVIFGGASDVAAGALRVAAATVPVVFATGSDPVAAGLVASLNRPGTYGSGRGACDETHVPTATSVRIDRSLGGLTKWRERWLCRRGDRVRRGEEVSNGT
jgi:putative tryptophan/tyrosine transport system substrate-binding protein